jgi:hypothetical protein
MCCDHYVANIIASFNVKLKSVLVSEHAHLGVSCCYGDTINTAKLVVAWVAAASCRTAKRLIARCRAYIAVRVAWSFTDRLTGAVATAVRASCPEKYR